jgi:hypothetical protein
MTSSPTTKEHSWANYFDGHPDRMASNKSRKDLAAFLDPSKSTTENVGKMIHNDDLILVCVAANKKYIMVLHHFAKLGATRLSPELCVVALCGNNDIATPVEIDNAASISSTTVAVPAWDDLFIRTDSVANFKAAPSVPGNEVELSSIILVPQALGVPVMKATTKDAATISIVIASALAQHEVVADADPSADSFMLHCHCALQFCWTVAAGKIASVVCLPSESPIIINVFYFNCAFTDPIGSNLNKQKGSHNALLKEMGGRLVSQFQIVT